MLNIVQHGDMFELRIDNQSFSHLYHQDRTKRAFVYDGQEEVRHEEHDEERVQSERQSAQDYGYGGYKRGHPDVKQDWNS